MPADPKRLQVLRSLQTALQGIAGEPTYHHRVKATSVVLDPSVAIFTVPPSELPYFVLEPTPIGSKFYQPASVLKHNFAALVTARMDAVGSSPNRKAEVWERLIADIEVAVTRDLRRGGIAVDTVIDGEPQPMVDVGTSQTVIVQVPLLVKLFRRFGEP